MTFDELLRSSGLTRPRTIVPESEKPWRKAVYVLAGHLHAAAGVWDITTILGSCVAVCIWDPVAGVGGMNHYMLPWDAGSTSGGLRYAAYAIPRLIEELLSLGGNRGRFNAEIFGGACVLRHVQHGECDLGARNIEAARRLLEAARIPIVHEDVGGQHGRRLTFSTDDGSCKLRII